MDWNSLNEKQTEFLIRNIKSRWPNVMHLDLYLSNQKVLFEAPSLSGIRVASWDRMLADYIAYLQRMGLANQLAGALFRDHRFREADWSGFEDSEWEVEHVTSNHDHPQHAIRKVVEPSWEQLSGQQLRLLREAIVNAYPNPKDFDMCLADKFGKRSLASHSAAGGSAQQLFDFLQEVNAEGWSRDLVVELEKTRRSHVRNLTEALTKV